MDLPPPWALDLPYKGGRQYLHSTDIFEALTALTGATGSISLKISGMIVHPVEVLPAAGMRTGENYPARFRCLGRGGEWDLLLRERMDEVVSRRIPYDEDAIADGASLRDDAIESLEAGSAKLIERIVALNKHLIKARHAGRTLLFASLFLARQPVRPDLRLVLESSLGTRLFRSSIHSGGERLGEIVFYGV